jgi:gliding motility-associated-like protein
VKLTVKGMGGQDQHSDTSKVYILPNAFFEMAPRVVYINDEAVNFMNYSENADIVLWEFGDGETSSELEPKHIYTKPGVFTVRLTVTTKNNCFDIYEKENAVMVEPAGRIEYPDVFSPSAQLEENKVFSPGVEENVEEYHLMIFNRWGELIFESNDIKVGWDGYYQGNIAKQDVYVYKAEGKYINGANFTKTGDVTLLH